MKEELPFAVYIKKLSQYNFNFLSTEEVVFFEYLVVKGKSFKFKQFYHSDATVEKETGIRRYKLNAIKYIHHSGLNQNNSIVYISFHKVVKN